MKKIVDIILVCDEIESLFPDNKEEETDTFNISYRTADEEFLVCLVNYENDTKIVVYSDDYSNDYKLMDGMDGMSYPSFFMYCKHDILRSIQAKTEISKDIRDAVSLELQKLEYAHIPCADW